MKLFYLILLFAFTCSGVVSAQVPFEAKSHDDFVLKGQLLPAAENAGTVLLLHQCNKDRHSLDLLGQTLNQAGLGALSLDFRGFGESTSDKFNGDTGHRALLFPHFARDMEAVLNVMDTKGLTQNGLGVVGVDCGGAMALLASLVHARINAVTLISPSLGDPWIGPSVWTALQNNDKTAYLMVNAAEDQLGAGAANQVFVDAPNYLNKIIWYKGRSRGAALFDLDPSLVYEISAWMAERLGMVPETPPGYVARDETLPSP